MITKSVTIYVDFRPFARVEEAAIAERDVDWQAEYREEHLACILSFAATEIASHLNRIEGVDAAIEQYPVQTGTASRAQSDQITDRGESFAIYLTAVESAAYNDVIALFPTTPVADEEQSFSITSDGQRGGERGGKRGGKRGGQPARYLIVGSDATGALYGGYELLRRFGFAWLSPDPWDQITPNEFEAVLVETRETPSFRLRGFWATDDRGTEPFLLWMARNKLNLWSAEQSNREFCRKLGIRFTTGGHTIFSRYADPKQYFGSHPEWYGLRDGTRSNRIDGVVGDNICFANDEARRHIADALAEDLAKGEWKWVDLINVWALDNGKYCECDECKHLGNPTDQIMLLANECRQSIKRAQTAGKINREVLVSIPAYHETLVVPQKPLPADFDHEGIVATFFPIERCFVHTFAAPECNEINAPLVKYWLDWTENQDNPFRGAMLVGEYYNVSSYASLAIPASRTMAADIPYYYQSGAKLMHFMHVGISNWGILALTNCQFAAMLWNHKIDTESFLHAYFETRYGEAAAMMSDGYRLLERAMENAKPLKHYAGMERHTLRNTLGKTGTQSGTEQTALQPSAEDGRSVAPLATEGRLFTTRHLRYAGSNATVDSGPSLTETLELLARTERIFDDALIGSGDDLVRRRLGSDIRRLRYTVYGVKFSYHAARIRMAEEVGDTETASLEARALRTYGEALRYEVIMPKLTENQSEDWYSYYKNGLTATWLAEFYEETMRRYCE